MRFLPILCLAAAVATPACAQPGDPLPKAATSKLVLDEDFSDRRAFEKRWVFGNSRYPDTIQTRTLPGNREKQLYTGGGFGGLGIDPYSIAGGLLTIEAKPLPPGSRAAIGGLADRAPLNRLSLKGREVVKAITHSSGLIASTGHFEGGYGYYEARLRIPTGKGDWPAFWLFDWSGKVEIDIMESVGDRPGCYHATLHSPYPPTRKSTKIVCSPTPLSDWHTYGALTTPTEVAFYLDRREVARFPALTGYKHAKWTVLLNLAQGGWPPDPDADHRATMQADYIRMWKAP